MDQDISTLITQFTTFSSDEDTSRYSKYSKSIAELIEAKELTLLQFVQRLGEKIVSTEDDERLKAVHCLTEVIHEIDNGKLSKQDINVLVEFYLNKFDDKYCFKYVIQGIDHLIHFNQFNPGLNDNLLKILSAINEKYDVANHLAKNRYEIFKLVDDILTVSRDAITTSKDLHDLYVKTFIQISTGEKDPRNLLMAFELNKRVGKYFSFDINNKLEKHYIDELYDNLFCYFPISFKPPPNDPYKITSEQLKMSLRSSLTSQPLYAQDLFNDLFEKLASTNPIVRNDVLLTMLEAVNTYDFEVLIQYWEKLWNGLRFEVLHFENPNLFDPTSTHLIPENLLSIDDLDENKPVYLVLEILTQLTIKLSDERIYLDFVTENLSSNLNITNKFFKQAIILLSCLASSTEDAFNYIQKFIFKYENLGKFISMPNTGDEEEPMEEDVSLTVSKQRDLIDNFGYTLISYQVISNKLRDNSSFFSSNYLVEVKDNLIVFLGQLLQVSSNIEKTLKCKIVQQYVKLIGLRRFLTYEEKFVIITILNDMFFELSSSKFDDIVVEEIIKGFTTLIAQKSDELNKLIIEIYLPNVISKLDENVDNMDVFEQYLGLLQRIIVNYQFLEVLSIRLINKLNYHAKEINFKIIKLIIQLILKIQSENQFLMNSWFKTFIPHLFTFLNKFDVNSVEEWDLKNFEITSELIGLIIKYNDSTKHQEILDQFVQSFYESKQSNSLNLTGYNLLKESNLMVIIYNKVLSNIDKSTNINVGDSSIGSLVELIYGCKNEQMKLYYLQHLSLLINKFYDNKEVLSLKLQELYTFDDLKKFEISIWIIKALVLKLHPVGMKYLNENLNNLDSKYSGIVLRAFDIVLKDLKIYSINKELPKGSKIISKVQNLNVRLLYKQQMFNIILDKILENSESMVYLTLLSVLLKNIDSTILRFKVNDIIPLIIKSIKVNSLLETSLETLLIITDSNDLHDHLPYLIKRLLEVSSTKVVEGGKLINNENIRILALDCLLKLIKTNEKSAILVYKTDILNKTTNGLDDPKRSVRKLCCDIRQLLFELRE